MAAREFEDGGVDALGDDVHFQMRARHRRLLARRRLVLLLIDLGVVGGRLLGGRSLACGDRGRLLLHRGLGLLRGGLLRVELGLWLDRRLHSGVFGQQRLLRLLGARVLRLLDAVLLLLVCHQASISSGCGF